MSTKGGFQLPKMVSTFVVISILVLLLQGCKDDKKSEPSPTVLAATATSVPTFVPRSTPTQLVPTPTAVLATATEVTPLQQKVFTTDNLNVRSGPGTSYPVIKTEPKNTTGVVLDGPVSADNLTWWKISYQDDVIGWSAQSWLVFGEPATNLCDFSKNVSLRPGKTFDMYGTETFDTVICGYVLLRDEMGGEASNVPITVPYFVIIRFADRGFEESVSKSVSSGNGVNSKEGGSYLFNLGCCKEGHIEGIERADGNPYIDQQSESAILSSTPAKPVMIILSFGKHLGSGCVCCNLAHRVRLY